MSVKVYAGQSDPNFQEVQEDFYNNFSPDDVDFIILGNQDEVYVMALRLEVCDHQMVELADGSWMAVTYHA